VGAGVGGFVLLFNLRPASPPPSTSSFKTPTL
jgi:hypothetical protein